MTGEESVLRKVIAEREDEAKRLEEKLAEERVVIEALRVRLAAARGEPTPEKPAPEELKEKLLSVPDALEYLGVSKTYLYERIADKDLRVVRFGDRNKFTIADLNDFIRRHTRSSKADIEEKAELILTARRLSPPRRGRRKKGAANV